MCSVMHVHKGMEYSSSVKNFNESAAKRGCVNLTFFDTIDYRYFLAFKYIALLYILEVFPTREAEWGFQINLSVCDVNACKEHVRGLHRHGKADAYCFITAFGLIQWLY